MKRSLFISFAILLLAGCNNSKNVTIKGYYPGDSHEYIYVNRIDIDIPVMIDSAKISKGRFSLSFAGRDPEFYQVGFDNSEFVTLLASPGDKINVTFGKGKLQNDYSISGSPDSELLKELDKKLSKTLAGLDSLRKEYETASLNQAGDERLNELEAAYLSLITEQRKYNIGFILGHMHSFASIKALYQRIDENTYVLYQPRDVQYMKILCDTLSKYYPNSRQTKALAANLEKELNDLYINQITSVAKNIEPSDLDANLPDINGKKILLSSLRKKYYVLLSFWSAQSEDCISNNLFLKQVYTTYHGKGFEIYQVSLDEDETLWKNSVTFDELPWISVREEDPAIPITARIFNITSVPSNYLIDKNGEIIGKDLFGRSLQIKLSQIFD